MEKKFKGAQYIVWQSLEDYQLFHAKFIYNNEQVNAFFEEMANLVAIGRYITTSSLPLAITKNIRANMPNTEMKDAIGIQQVWRDQLRDLLENEKTRLGGRGL